jgi:hypothetical protein
MGRSGGFFQGGHCLVTDRRERAVKRLSINPNNMNFSNLVRDAFLHSVYIAGIVMYNGRDGRAASDAMTDFGEGR